MAGKKEKREGYGKILDAWTAPEGAGDAIGCVATSFTFSPVFFEEECLSRFLGIESDPIEDGPLYLVEREEKLAQVVCASALIDQHNCKGSRSLRWDMLPAKVPGGLLHAKVTLLHWTELVRVIVASANLTEDGYRRNQEIFGVLDYHLGCKTPLSCLREIITFLRQAGSYSESGGAEASPALRRWNHFLDRVSKASPNWGSENQASGSSEARVWPIFSGPGFPNVFESLSGIWPGSAPPTAAYVISPFFDPPDSPNRPAKGIWQALRKRGETVVGFSVTAEQVDDEEGVFVHAPASLLASQPKDRADATTEFYWIDIEQGRPLHAKAIWLDNRRWAVYMIGSSNFTSAGLGLKASGNLEANLAYGINHEKNPKAYRILEKSFIQGEEIDLDQHLKWQPRSDEGEDSADDEVVLPNAFGSAVYDWDPQKQPIIILTFTGIPPEGWRLVTEDDKKAFFAESDWNQGGKKEKVVILWQDTRPPSGFWVTWKELSRPAWLPVNVASAASLPPPQELKNLPLEVLINILTSARPLHRAIKEYLKRKKRGDGGNGPGGVILDPHKRVDTSQFLLQKTRRVSWALNGLRERIERPVISEECMQWRLRGPVGVLALADALCQEARSDEEMAFLISELALELARAKPREALNCLPTKKVRKEIHNIVIELKNLIPFDQLSKQDKLKEYVDSVFSAILK